LEMTEQGSGCQRVERRLTFEKRQEDAWQE
jgi:hypothetical protein